MMALVTMCGLNSCSEDCDHEFIEYDYSQALVGTWTCLQGNYAKALVINADGSAVSTGVEDGEYWEGVKGNIKTVNNKMTMTFEDEDNWEGRFEMVAGEAFTIYEENGESFTFRYCANDLAEEIVGMWVCTNSFANTQNDMLIQTFKEDGTSIMTGYISDMEDFVTNAGGSTYKVIGDLFINILPADAVAGGVPPYMAMRLDYAPNGTGYGDIMTFTHYLADGTKNSDTYLRIKQHLELPGMKYDYIKTFVTNVKGLDKDIEFMGTTFNFAKMDGVMMDKALKAILFNVEFPDANTIKYSCYYNNQPMSMEAPIAVDGNKMTVKMSEKNAAYKNVDLYTFQDQDNTQMHMYMHSTAFVNFFGNMQVTIMEQLGQLDTTDEAAVKAVFDSIDDAVETINVSFVMTRAK